MKHLLNIMKSSTQARSAGEKFSIATQRLMLSVLFLTGAALIPLQANAVPFVDGNSTTADQVVNNAGAWTTLRSVTFNTPANTNRRCIATGSSDAKNHLFAGAHQYRFTLSLDKVNPPVDTGFERQLEFENQRVGAADNLSKEITSTGGVFSTGLGRHTIRWQARKIGGAANMTVADSSLSVVCTDREEVIFRPIDPPRFPPLF